MGRQTARLIPTAHTNRPQAVIAVCLRGLIQISTGAAYYAPDQIGTGQETIFKQTLMGLFEFSREP